MHARIDIIILAMLTALTYPMRDRLVFSIVFSICSGQKSMENGGESCGRRADETAAMYENRQRKIGASSDRPGAASSGAKSAASTARPISAAAHKSTPRKPVGASAAVSSSTSAPVGLIATIF